MAVGRPKRPIESLMVDLPLKVLPDTAREIEELADSLERSKSFINRKLLLRGLAAYRRDGRLAEIDDVDLVKQGESDAIPAPRHRKVKR